MRLGFRVLAPVLVGVAAFGLTLAAAGSEAFASSPRVTIVDNDGPVPRDGLDARTGQWGFAPYNIVVTQGEGVTFVNPDGNFRPHNVVSIFRSGSSAEPVLESGNKFTSGLAMDTWLRPANSWTLDTAGVDPGYYSYYCSLHPWMVGTITILPQ